MKRPSGPRLLLLPGLHGNGPLFQRLIAALPEGLRARTRALELSRRGDYRYPDHCAWLARETSNLGPYVILGESFAASIALHYALQKPRGLRGLITLGGFSDFPGKKLPPAHATKMVPPLPMWWWIFKRWLKKDLFADMDDEGGLEVVRAGLKAAGGRALAGRVACVMTLQLGPRLHEIGVPTLVIHGKRDRFVPHAAADKLAQSIPQARQVWVDAPHAISWIRPKETAQAIVRFMRTIR